MVVREHLRPLCLLRLRSLLGLLGLRLFSFFGSAAFFGASLSKFDLLIRADTLRKVDVLKTTERPLVTPPCAIRASSSVYEINVVWSFCMGWNISEPVLALLHELGVEERVTSFAVVQLHEGWPPWNLSTLSKTSSQPVHRGGGLDANLTDSFFTSTVVWISAPRGTACPSAAALAGDLVEEVLGLDQFVAVVGLRVRQRPSGFLRRSDLGVHLASGAGGG